MLGFSFFFQADEANYQLNANERRRVNGEPLEMLGMKIPSISRLNLMPGSDGSESCSVASVLPFRP